MSKNEILVIVYSCVLVILLCLSFFFSSSDMAYGSVDSFRYEKALKDDPNNKKLLTAQKLSVDYSKTISTILFCNDTVNAGLDSLSTLVGVNLAYVVLTDLDAVALAESAELWGLVASIICLIIKITFGEIIAKSVGKIYNFKLTVVYSRILDFLKYLFYPITFLVSSFGEIVVSPITKNVKDVVIIEDDLHEMVDDIENNGQVDEKKANLLHETIRYTHTEAYEVMTPRVDLNAIDIDDDINDIINDPDIYTNSRIPVYKETIDNIIGYVKSKELMVAKITGQEIKLKDILLEPLRFPRSTEINEILKTFKTKKEHFAIVMDEYGGVEGVITMEDILEEIVGEIWDENDDPDARYSKKKDGSYIIDGSLTLEDFCDLFELDYDELDTEYVTIGGYIVELLDDKFAKVNDVVTLENLEIKVIAVEKTGVVEKLLVKKIEEDEEDDEKEEEPKQEEDD